MRKATTRRRAGATTTFLMAGTLAVALLSACGGGSPEDQISGVARDHLVALAEFNGEGTCGPMGSEAVEDYADAGDDVEGWETAIESAFCEYTVETQRENFDDLDGSDKETANAVLEALRGVEMEPAEVNSDGISATVTSKPFKLEVAGEEAVGQVRYSMTKENGAWLVNEAVLFEEGTDPEEDGDTIFPDPY